MPKIYRVMQADGDRPKTGSSSATLGVRLPGGPGKPDIVPDADGDVRPGTGGLSVSPRLEDLPPAYVPRRFRHLVPDADGGDRYFVWVMGTVRFAPAPVALGLNLRPDPARRNHGFVEPDAAMAADDFHSALHATGNSWEKADG